MKITALKLAIGWILWLVGMEAISGYIIDRPMNSIVQLVTVIGVIIATVFLFTKTYKYIINNLNN